MKISPLGDIVDAKLPDSIVSRRRQIARAVEEDNAALIGEQFREWRSWIVSVENDSTLEVEHGASLSFVWNRGASSSARFETACLAYAYARALFHLRNYALAYVHFGLALEETMQCRDPLPLSANACGAFRLRCLVRAQRLGACELTLDDARQMLPRAIWLEFALDKYAQFPGASSKEPLGAGKSLVATARAAITGRPEHARIAVAWKQNPFYLEMLDTGRRQPQGSPIEPETSEGEFDWDRFTSGRTYSA